MTATTITPTSVTSTTKTPTDTTTTTGKKLMAAPAGFRIVEISREPVELYKILKFENLAGSGAEAKAAVGSGHVAVNGKPETRKRRQIVAGDTIEFGNEKLFIKFAVSKPAAASPPLEANSVPGKVRARPATRKKSDARNAIQIAGVTGSKVSGFKGQGFKGQDSKASGFKGQGSKGPGFKASSFKGPGAAGPGFKAGHNKGAGAKGAGRKGE